MDRAANPVARTCTLSTTLRIVFFSTVHPHPWAPTKGAFNAAMLRGLVALGADVRAVVPVPWTERRGTPVTVDPGYPVEFVPFWFVPRIAPLALATQLGWCAGRALRRAASQADLLLGYWADPDGTVVSRIAARSGKPFVQMVGGSDVLLLANDSARGRRIGQTLRQADLVLSIGEHLRTTLIAQGIASDKVIAHQRGVDRRRFGPGDREAARRSLELPPDRKILLWVGRMVPVKGLDVLLAALSLPQLAPLGPLLVLVGDGPDREALERQAAASLPTGAVRFAGSVPHDELATWYQAADLMVLPSRSEGIPNVLLEGMACGVGFVASAVGSVAELAHDPARDLVPPGDPIRLAAAVADRLILGQRADFNVPDASDSARVLHSHLLAASRRQN